MSKIKNLKRNSYLFSLLLCVALFSLGCNATSKSNTNTSVKNEKPAAATKSVAVKELEEVKVSKPNEGGLKQELSTKATVSTIDNKQITFEVPASQLQGLKVGDALAINSGRDAYPATIVTIPQAQPVNPNSATKVIVTAQVGPGINLPGNKRDYTATYLYNNRNPRSHYIKKNYVYYDGLRPYVYITGPDRVIRRKYIRTGLINRYYAEILDELDNADRIVESYINDYVNNIVVPNVIEDYTNQVIDAYQEYIETLNQRWDDDDDVNSFTIDVDDVDWEKLEELDTILTDGDIAEIYDDIQAENYISENDYQGNGVAEEELLSYGDINYDKDDDKNDYEINNVATSDDEDKDGTNELPYYEIESNVETTSDDDLDVNDTTTTTYDNDNYTDNDLDDDMFNDNNQQNDELQDNYPQDDAVAYDDLNDDDYNFNDDDSDFSGYDFSDEEYETTISEFEEEED